MEPKVFYGDKVKIGPHILKIQETARDIGLTRDEYRGVVHHRTNIIRVDEGMATSKKEESVLHEILHEINQCFLSPVLEEGQVNVLAGAILAVLKDNKYRFDGE